MCVSMSSNRFTELVTNPLLNVMNVRRFSNMPLLKEDTDATHSYRLQLMSIILFQNNPKVDLKTLIYKCCLHDMNEAGAGDIISPIKHLSVDVNKAIEAKSNEILKEWGVSDYVLKEISECKDSSIEGKILSILDALDAYYTLYFEYKIQQSPFLYDRADDCISYVGVKLDEKFKDDPDNEDIYKLFKQLIDDAGKLLKAIKE